MQPLTFDTIKWVKKVKRTRRKNKEIFGFLNFIIDRKFSILNNFLTDLIYVVLQINYMLKSYISN